MVQSVGGITSSLIGSTGTPVSEMHAEQMTPDDLLRAGLNKLGGGNPYYPQYGQGVVPGATLNTQPALAEIQKNLAADTRPIALLYGNCQVGGNIFALDYSNGLWTVGYVLGLGEIESVVQVWINGEAPVAGVSVNTYTGTTTQTADPLLAAAITDYTDTLVISTPDGDIGIAYAVLQYTDEHYDAWPRVLGEVEGRKVWNPKTSTTVYSKNPALQYGDLLSSSFYGLGLTVDNTALEACQDACDDVTAGEVRRESYLVIDRAQDTTDWAEVLRAYASCFLVYRGDVVHLVPDRPAANVMSINPVDMVGLPSIVKKDSSDIPTRVRIRYTDKTGNEWRERLSDPAELPGVALGTVPTRESIVRMSGIDRHSQAYREAVERLNKLTLSDLEVDWLGFDEMIELESGDVIDITHPLGLTAKPMRVIGDPAQSGPGRYQVKSQEYDAAAYSNEIVTDPSYTDGNLPTSGAPDAVVGLSVGETTYQLLSGEYASRLDISWTASTNIFVTGYSVVVKDGMQVIWGPSNTTLANIATSPLLESVNYTVEVSAYSPLFIGPAASANYQIIGKTAIPDPPASMGGFEVGGEVRLSWPASTDVDAKRYEIRYGTTGGSWETATVLDIVDGLRLNTKNIPPGTFRFYVKTIDSIFQYSTTAVSIDILVTLDDDAFRAGSLEPIGDGATKTFIHTIEEIRGSGIDEHYSDGNDTWSSLFSGAAMSTFTNALASYQSAQGESFWYSEELDLLADKTGSFVGAIPHVDHSGTATVEIGLKTAAGSYVWSTTLAQKGTARYVQMRVRSSGIFQVSTPAGSIAVDVIAREEVGSVTTSATLATTITLSRQYSGVRSIVLTPEGTTDTTVTYDNIVLDVSGFTEFDVYAFDAGAQAAKTVRWAFKGV